MALGFFLPLASSLALTLSTHPSSRLLGNSSHVKRADHDESLQKKNIAISFCFLQTVRFFRVAKGKILSRSPFIANSLSSGSYFFDQRNLMPPILSSLFDAFVASFLFLLN
jgi:hypothetical protein